MLDDLIKLLPEVELIENDELRNKVVKTFDLGMKKGNWRINDVQKLPYTATYATQIGYCDHIRLVTQSAVSMYNACCSVFSPMPEGFPPRDYLIAGALLHDVGKLMELSFNSDGNITKSANGILLRHAFTGVYLAMECQLPDEIVHIIAVHSQEGIASHPTFLAQLVRLADQMAERYSDWDLQHQK